MTALYPLRFEPLYKHYIWGGRRFESVLGRSLEPDKVYAESWEIADHGQDQSVVQVGPLAGTSLHRLAAERREELLGRNREAQDDAPLAGRFPLLLKFLDAAQDSSIQVHPDDRMAARLTPPDLGKTEAWIVLDARPGSRICAGLRPGVDRTVLARAVAEGACAECIHMFEPEPGDCIFVPAGAVHALGAGILAAEIQQASNTTFRLFDWNRVGPDGKPRQLHVEQALEATDFDLGPVEPLRPATTERNTAVPIVECDQFALSRWDLDAPGRIGGDGHCHLVSVLDGAVSVEGDPAAAPLPHGRTVLLPASLPPAAFDPQPRATLLDARVP